MLKKPNILRKTNNCLVKMAAPYVKLDTPLSDHTVVCRGCLANSGEMKNIREWGLIADYRKYTGIHIRRADEVSELLCTACEDTLMKCKLFELQCKKSDITLKCMAMREAKPAIEQNTMTFKLNKNELIFSIVAPDLESIINFPCPYNCNNTYTKKSDLLNHLIKLHEHSKDYDIKYQYYCWHDCVYNKNSMKNKYFTARKYLNQHFNKVHRKKIFHCDKCDGDFSTITDFKRHHTSCNMVYLCEECHKSYSNHARLLVHLMRRHPDKHKEYKEAKKAEKRKSTTETITKRPRRSVESFYESDSPKRSFATQTSRKDSVKNDVTLPFWQNANNEISTQTGFENLLSIKSSEEDSLFYSETTLSDIQTQTIPLEFGLVVKRSNKETLTESLDMSIKGTQTCFCFCDSPKFPFGATDSKSSSPRSLNLTSTETQTAELKTSVIPDELLSLNSTETQTCFDEAFKESL